MSSLLNDSSSISVTLFYEELSELAQQGTAHPKSWLDSVHTTGSVNVMRSPAHQGLKHNSNTAIQYSLL